jgi:hypothetical protein
MEKGFDNRGVKWRISLESPGRFEGLNLPGGRVLCEEGLWGGGVTR